MTEQEVEVFARRLTRIWKPDGEPEGNMLYIKEDGCFVGQLTHPDERDLQVVLVVAGIEGGFYCDIHSLEGVGYLLAGSDGSISSPHQYRGDATIQALIAKWLPFFRRGTWLSGCPIEASAHEKAEWMHGFSQQEIEAWNLKF